MMPLDPIHEIGTRLRRVATRLSVRWSMRADKAYSDDANLFMRMSEYASLCERVARAAWMRSAIYGDREGCDAEEWAKLDALEEKNEEELEIALQLFEKLSKEMHP